MDKIIYDITICPLHEGSNSGIVITDGIVAVDAFGAKTKLLSCDGCDDLYQDARDAVREALEELCHEAAEEGTLVRIRGFHETELVGISITASIVNRFVESLKACEGVNVEVHA